MNFDTPHIQSAANFIVRSRMLWETLFLILNGLWKACLKAKIH